MNTKALLLVITASVCCYYQANGTEACDYFFEPFDGKIFAGVSLSQCRRFCLEAEQLHCESFMYNSIERNSMLSAQKRSSHPSTDGYNKYQYFERSSQCDPVNLTAKIVSCSATSHYNTDYACEYSYGGADLAAGPRKEWAMGHGKGVGEWMQVNLDTSYVLTSIEIYPRCHHLAQFSSLNVHVGGEVILVSRTCGTSTLWRDCSGPGNAMIPVRFPHPIRTTYVKFEVKAVCDPSRISIGIREIKLLGFEG